MRLSSLPSRHSWMTRWSAGSPTLVVTTSSMSTRKRWDPSGIGPKLSKVSLSVISIAASTDLGVARPRARIVVVWIDRCTVKGHTPVSFEVPRLQRAGHHPEPQITVLEGCLDPADPGSPVDAKGRDGLVTVGVEQSAGRDCELRSRSNYLIPARHRYPPASDFQATISGPKRAAHRRLRSVRFVR